MLDEPFGNIGGQREALGCQLGESIEVNGHRLDHAGDGGAQDVQGVYLVEDGLLVFLEIPVVGQGNSLENREQTGEISDEAPRLSTRELGDVGVLLLWHDRGSGRVGVIERHVAELLGVPDDDLLRQPRDVDSYLRADEGKLRNDIASGGAVNRVGNRV